jgi:hypothetical protein
LRTVWLVSLDVPQFLPFGSAPRTESRRFLTVLAAIFEVLSNQTFFSLFSQWARLERRNLINSNSQRNLWRLSPVLEGFSAGYAYSSPAIASTRMNIRRQDYSAFSWFSFFVIVMICLDLKMCWIPQ